MFLNIHEYITLKMKFLLIKQQTGIIFDTAIYGYMYFTGARFHAIAEFNEKEKETSKQI